MQPCLCSQARKKPNRVPKTSKRCPSKPRGRESSCGHDRPGIPLQFWFCFFFLCQGSLGLFSGAFFPVVRRDVLKKILQPQTPPCLQSISRRAELMLFPGGEISYSLHWQPYVPGLLQMSHKQSQSLFATNSGSVHGDADLRRGRLL